MIMPDFNWLYSAMAQSAAAFVAIVGAFMTNKVLGISSERSTFRKEIEVLESEIQTRQDMFEELKYELECSKIRYMIENRSILDELIQSHIPARDLVENPYQFLKTFISRKYEQREGAIPNSITKKAMDDMLPWIYDKTMDKLNLSNPLLQPAVARSIPPDVRPQEEIRSKTRDQESEIKLLEGQKHRKEKEMEALSQPQGIIWGFASLLWLLIFGVFMPLVLLRWPTPGYKTNPIVWGLYASGYVFSLIYLGSQIFLVIQRKESK